ncbi:MAG: DUF6807 family protein [Pirellulaceae bacterium]
MVSPRGSKRRTAFQVNGGQWWIAASCGVAVATNFMLVLAAAEPVATTAGGDIWRVQNHAEGIAIAEGSSPVLFYQRAPKSVQGRYERCGYVHPLYSLDGDVLTEDFPADHLHQRGVYWAWHQMWVGDQRVGDGWAIKDFSWEVTRAAVEHTDAHQVRMAAQVLWKSPLWCDDQGKPRPLVREQTTITVHRATEQSRKIDFRIELLALTPGLRVGGSEDEKGYSGFSARVRLPEDVRFIGTSGAVEPAFGGVAAGPWIDIQGTFAPERPSGLAILCHPTLPGFPQPWVLRRSRSMQNPAWPGRETAAISHEQPLTLRYRLVVHRNGATQADGDVWQAEYAAETP